MDANQPAGAADLAGLLSSALATLPGGARRVSFEAGQVLIEQEEVPGRVLLIESGLASSRSYLANGKDILVALHGPGITLGDLEYFCGGIPAACRVTALEATRCLLADYRTMGLVLEREPRLGAAFASLLARRLLKASQRMSSGLGYPLEHALLEAALAKLAAGGPSAIEDAMGPDARGPLLKRDLASYLGLSERHASRLVKALGARGILRLEKGAVVGIDEKAARRRLLELES